MIMESISAYFTANPTAFTLLTIVVVLTILYFIISKFIKIAIILLIVILLFGGVTLFKDPASMPDKIKKSVQTFKTGGEQLLEKLTNIRKDSKEIAGKAKKVPGDINKLLDAAKEEAGK